MRNLRNLFFAATICIAAFSFTGCDDEKDDDNNAISQTIEIGGIKYQKVLGLYHQWEEGGAINIDIDTDFDGDNNVHGFGEFDEKLVGKTVDLTTDSLFNISFNYLEPDPIYQWNFTPNYKSGTLTISKVSKGYHILLNSIHSDGKAFKMDLLMIDEEEFNRSQK